MTVATVSPQLKATLAKARKQLAKDYVVHPLLSGPSMLHTLRANMMANLVRNVWSHAVIMCGHFPEGVETYEKAAIPENETRGEWYLRQMLGSANFHAGPIMRFMSGNLCYQIEHHLFPSLARNRLKAAQATVRAFCEARAIPYHETSVWQAYRAILRHLHHVSAPLRQADREESSHS